MALGERKIIQFEMAVKERRKGKEMEKLKELTLEDLRNITWDYNKYDILGEYKGICIGIYLFEVKKWEYLGEAEEPVRSPLIIQSCNVEEGWIEFIECTGEPIKNDKGKILLPGRPMRDADLNIMKTNIQCISMTVDILDTEGKVIETLLRGKSSTGENERGNDES